MVDVPADTPVITPVKELAVAIPVLPLAHVPPPASLKAVDKPAQTAAIPVIDEGNGLTVTFKVAMQPVVSV